MKFLCLMMFSMFAASASAQWAVYDYRVHRELERINHIRDIAADDLQAFEDLSTVDTDFSTVQLADRTRYITTIEDCGDQDLNPKHFTACQGLRNLRLKTLEQSEALLRVIETRRGQIRSVINRAGSLPNESGQLQRLHFELQGLQALMQSDGMRLEVIMSAYKQREKMYEVQMTEARRASDTKRAGARSMGAVPFLPELMR